jgi:hypothetical protein
MRWAAAAFQDILESGRGSRNVRRDHLVGGALRPDDRCKESETS